jgi:CheY-like chemotaxis protein
MTAKRVLSVGQCMADHGGISHTLRQSFGAAVESADTVAEALTKLRDEPFALMLVNRVFDADGSSGMDLIEALRADANLRDVPVMLVSNFEDAQKQAVSAGAVPGFGKSELGRPAMLERVRVYLG